jgi:hypothetical protein
MYLRKPLWAYVRQPVDRKERKRNMKKNELTITNSAFLKLKDFDLTDAFSEELAGLTGSFERIKIPAAGSTVFEVPGEDPNNPEAVKEFSAVILYHHPLYAYYKNKYTGGSNPPDCGSFDGITGEGYPGGSCSTCSNNKFGSGEGGGKACKNRRRIYLLREGEIFPMLLSLPTGSLKDFTRYLMRLLSKGKKSNAVVTRFALKKATNASGIVYSQAQFAVDRDLLKEEYHLINTLSEQVKSFSAKVGYDTDPASEEQVDPETGEFIEPLV